MTGQLWAFRNVNQARSRYGMVGRVCTAATWLKAEQTEDEGSTVGWSGQGTGPGTGSAHPPSLPCPRLALCMPCSQLTPSIVHTTPALAHSLTTALPLHFPRLLFRYRAVLVSPGSPTSVAFCWPLVLFCRCQRSRCCALKGPVPASAASQWRICRLIARTAPPTAAATLPPPPSVAAAAAAVFCPRWAFPRAVSSLGPAQRLRPLP